jgi:replicative DNA helicase
MYRSNYDLSDDPLQTHPLGIFADNELRPMQIIDAESDDLLTQWESGFNGFTTGLHDLDQVFHLFPGELTIIGAMSSMGKTVLGMQMIKSMAQQVDPRGECVVVFSAEMSGAMLELRMASGAAGVNLHHLRLGKGTDADFARVRQEKETIRTLPIWFDDSKRPTTLTMMNKIKELNDTIKVRGMLFDFMELAGDENENEERRVAFIGQALSGIAHKLQIPVIALSQLNEKASDRANKMPSINDLRYSRTLTHITDNIILPVRPAYYIERGQTVSGFPDEDVELFGVGKPQGLAYLLVGKQRNGENKLVRTLYDKTLTKFMNLEVRRTPLN